VSGTARLRLAGLPSTGKADLRDENTAERCRVDRHRHGGQAAPGQDLRQQAPDGVADAGRLPAQPADDLVEMVGHPGVNAT
jgi:hypothetical protein